MSTTTTALTPRQRDVLEWIIGYIDGHGYGPTRREIAHQYRWSINAVTGHLTALRRKGYVTWVDGHSRTLRVLEVPHDG